MKKYFLFFAIICSTFFVNANQTEYMRASDVSIIKVIPDEIYNNNYSAEENGEAYETGISTLERKDSLVYDNFYQQSFKNVEMLVYDSLVINKIVFKTTHEALGEPEIAWITMIIVVLLYAVFIYLFMRFKDKVNVPAAAAAAVVVAAVVVVVVPAAVVAAAVVVAALVAALVAADFKKPHLAHLFFSVISILGMCIIWYFFTPLFLVCTVAGITTGYSIYFFTRKPEA